MVGACVAAELWNDTVVYSEFEWPQGGSEAAAVLGSSDKPGDDGELESFACGFSGRVVHSRLTSTWLRAI